MADEKKAAGVEVRWLVSDTARQAGDTEKVDRKTADDLLGRNLVAEV